MRSARRSAFMKLATHTQAALALALIVSASLGCPGKIAMIPDDGGVDEAGIIAVIDDAGFTDADEGDADVDPVIDSVSPSSGPNSGGTLVTIAGAGFTPTTQIYFAGFPAAEVRCKNPHICTAITPFAGYDAEDQVDHVEATNGGTLGAVGTRTSAETPRDLFRFTAGPKCMQSLLCVGADPLFQMACPQTVSFYFLARTEHQALLATAQTYAFQTQSTPVSGAICFGDPTTTSCTSVELYEPKWSVCGDVGYCEECKRCGGECSTLSSGDPICSKWQWPPPGGC